VAPEGEDNGPLQLAAKCLDADDPAGALPHLSGYVTNHPDHAVIRAHLAEVLFRLDRRAEARREFEHYIADAQQQGAPADRHLIHAHTRLVDLAAAEKDDYRQHLHRGIGLYELARRTDKDAGDPTTQRLLCRAIKELELARKTRPDEARPHWYLHRAWTDLGQSHPATKHLNLARAHAPTSDLTPNESATMVLEARPRSD
jgi:tetratricopeptide (TPR) repeat protein